MKQNFDVTGMSCAACSARVEKCVGALDGVQSVSVNLLKNRMSVEYDSSSLSDGDIIKAVEHGGYGASVKGKSAASQSKPEKINDDGAQQKTELRRLICSVILTCILMYAAMGHMLHLPMPPFLCGAENAGLLALTQLFLVLPVMALNHTRFTRGIPALLRGAPNMDTLIAVGSGASFIYGVYSLFGIMYSYSHGMPADAAAYAGNLYFDSAGMILTLIAFGKYLEARAKKKTTDAIYGLMDLSPQTAFVLKDGEETEIPSAEIQVGDIICVRSGEHIACDGVIISGEASIDEAAVTGESIPVDKSTGNKVIGGTVCLSGYFRMRAERVGADTALAQIIRLVDEATSSKAPVAELTDKVSGIFVPVVMGISALTAAIWLLLGGGITQAFTAAVSVLVISCPCALGLATPTAIMVGTGRAGSGGILIKSAQALQTTGSIDTVVLDKTGTVTMGMPQVTDVIPLGGISSNELLQLAYSLEEQSSHPLAGAVVRYAQQHKTEKLKLTDFRQSTGLGVSGKIGNDKLCGGNAKIAEGLTNDELRKKEIRLAEEGKTPMYFTKNGRLIGIIAAADRIKPTSADAVSELKKLGIDVIMLTGDNKRTAEAIGKAAGIDRVISEVMPDEKENRIRELTDAGRRVAMVGDGINDAPALARADVGIAIGAGTDIAIDSADIVLMKSDLYDVVNAVRLSRAVMRIIKQNLFWAFFYNSIGIPIAAGALSGFGIMLSPMIGAAAMSFSSVCVVTNALRLRHFRFSSPKIRVSENTNKITKTEVKEMDNKTVLSVEGMMCQHCVAHVKKALEEVDGVKEVNVLLEEKRAEITGSADREALVAAVKAAGYDAE